MEDDWSVPACSVPIAAKDCLELSRLVQKVAGCLVVANWQVAWGEACFVLAVHMLRRCGKRPSHGGA